MKNYQIGAYYFPNFHPNEKNDQWHGKGWTEWELMKQARPRFEGHEQPKIPLWGYEDESDPAVMEKKIKAASDAGLDCFIFDWYWYENCELFGECLKNGFLKAKNAEDIKFALMFANHDWCDLHPAKRNTIDIAPSLTYKISKDYLYYGFDYVIENYFTKPNYWKVDGGLYFSVYNLQGLAEVCGGLKETGMALEDFRNKAERAGVGKLHLNAIFWGAPILPGETVPADPNLLVKGMGFDSVTSYVWPHHHYLKWPFTDYAELAKECEGDFDTFGKKYCVPYYPNVTVGWDPSPRTCQTDKYEETIYPFTPIVNNNTPEEFEKALRAVKTKLDASDLPAKMFTINAWNEWTEGSYLEPDTKYGYGYLDAIKKVFKK